MVRWIRNRKNDKKGWWMLPIYRKKSLENSTWTCSKITCHHMFSHVWSHVITCTCGVFVREGPPFFERRPFVREGHAFPKNLRFPYILEGSRFVFQHCLHSTLHFVFLSDEGHMLKTLDFAFCIDSEQTFLYFDLYFNTAYAAHYILCFSLTKCVRSKR